MSNFKTSSPSRIIELYPHKPLQLPGKNDRRFQQERTHKHIKDPPTSSCGGNLHKASMMGFFEWMRGYHDDVAREFSISLTPLTRTNATTLVKDLLVEMNLEVISRITTLPLGLPWRKEDKGNITLVKKRFFWKERSQWRKKMGLEGRELHTLGMKCVTISSNIFHVEGDTV